MHIRIKISKILLKVQKVLYNPSSNIPFLGALNDHALTIAIIYIHKGGK